MPDQYLFFGAEITPQSATNFMNYLVTLSQAPPDHLIIAMNSPGGTVVSGIAMYQMMIGMPFPIITHNIGNVDSIANAVFLGGGERYASPASTFMFHGVAFIGTANERLDENNLDGKLDTILADHRRISGIFATRTNDKITVKAGMRLFKEQRTRNGKWALDRGIVMAIRDLVIPTGALVQFFT